jgi:hypothetical protein
VDFNDLYNWLVTNVILWWLGFTGEPDGPQLVYVGDANPGGWHA